MTKDPYLVKLFDSESEALGHEHMFEVDALGPLDAISSVLASMRITQVANLGWDEEQQTWHTPVGLTAVPDPDPDPDRPSGPRLV